MNIGFHMCYHHSDKTITGLSMARQLVKNGHDVQILTMGTRVKLLDNRWNTKLINGSEIDYWDWVEKQDIVIWPIPPSAPQVIHANAKGVKTIIVAFNDDLKEDLKDSYTLAKVVVSPLLQTTFLLRDKWNLPKCYYWPLDLDLPITRKPDKAVKSSLSVLFPLCGSQSNYIMFDVFDVIKEVAEKRQDVNFTIMYANSFINEAVRLLTEIAKFNPNVKLIKEPTWNDQIKLFANHDLTVRTETRDGCGLNYLASIIQGTPVLSYDVAPVREFVGNLKNAILIKTDEEVGQLNVPIAAPDYTQLAEELLHLLYVEEINKYHQNITDEIHAHEKFANDGLLNAID